MSKATNFRFLKFRTILRKCNTEKANDELLKFCIYSKNIYKYKDESILNRQFTGFPNLSIDVQSKIMYDWSP